jgi:hypothetical protein
MTSISLIAERINQIAPRYLFGRLPETRKRLTNKPRVSSVIFNTANKSVNEAKGWACHSGGREELQFNIGHEANGQELRYGVAFSLETSPSMFDITVFNPKIALFNEYLRFHREELEDLRMWITRTGKNGQDVLVSPRSALRPIVDSEAVRGNFLFFGRTQPANAIDYEEIGRTFDRLFPLYCFVENDKKVFSPSSFQIEILPFQFREGVTVGSESSCRTGKAGLLTVALRSNQIKGLLVEMLRNSLTEALLGDEIPSGNGGQIDLVAELSTGRYVFYEIKPADFARDAIRQALPQLLEYAYRKGGVEAERLVVVSQAPLDPDSEEFLAKLREKGFPVWYQQIAINSK